MRSIIEMFLILNFCFLNEWRRKWAACFFFDSHYRHLLSRIWRCRKWFDFNFIKLSLRLILMKCQSSYLSLSFLLTSHFTHFTCKTILAKINQFSSYIRTPNVSICALFSMDLDFFFLFIASIIYTCNHQLISIIQCCLREFDIHLQINNYFAYVIQ